jgi:hypothetical protein
VLRRRLGPLLVVALVLVSTSVVAETGEREPMLVGFEAWPSEQLADDEWANRSLEATLPQLAVVQVPVEDERRFREEVGSRDNVAFVERDVPARVMLSPDDPLFGDQEAPAQIGLPSAWDDQLGSSDVRVGIVDSGIADTHEDLEGAVVAERDFANGDGQAEDDCGHGTHVAGIAAARTDNGVGVAGSSDAALVDAKALALDDESRCLGSASDVADAIRWAADQGSHVVSMSLGFDQPTRTVDRALGYAADAGALMTASVGNDGCNDCVSYPASDDRVIAVACTDDSETRCSFSNTGPEVELAAPGRGVLSTVPGDDYAYKSGTSMSTPFVAGTAALLASEDGSLDRHELRGLLTDHAQDLGPDGRDGAYGHGEVDAEASLGAAIDYNRPPEAAMDVACVSLTCTFDAGPSSDPDGDALTYDWTLSDGTDSRAEVFEHTFALTSSTRSAEGDTHTAWLTVSDGNLTDEAERSVTVRLEVQLEAHPLEPVFGPLEQPTIETRVLRLDAEAVPGPGTVEGVDVDVQTRWVPQTDPTGLHASLLGWDTLAETLRDESVVYHETREPTSSAAWTPIEIPSEAGSGAWAPTPGHRVLATLNAELAGQTYDASTTYGVGLTG